MGAGLALACLAGWRFWRQLVWMRPAPARLISDDYGADEQAIDRDWAQVSPHDVRLGKEWRATTCRVVFEDEDGNEHRADVTQRHWYGERPDTALVVWYDPRDPSRVTAGSPWGWLALAAGATAAAVACGWWLR
ncbi:hypothetical protein DVW87_15350 [Sphingomonas aracearum]|uniref:DUF3592 domain-containing protein n=2 Tax=Sphingomonas aracearum TaxID=2283317 RepID=A0A369VTS9_9SPHN|nr:hypothetical protein DVW87_15350 [Sphingomonas aracearum]